MKNYPDEIVNNGLIEILNGKIKLKREIDIYSEGFKIENIGKFNELKAIVYPNWKFRLNNYDLLDLKLPFIYYLNYNKLEECVINIKNDLPSTFFDKFYNINFVDLYNVKKGVDGFNWFINNVKYLSKLRTNSGLPSLGQVFYNNLPVTIRYLFIYNIENIDYGFILKLPKLVQFKTSIDKDLFNSAFNSFLNLKYLEEFAFLFKSEHIEIRRNDKDFYLYDGKRKKKLDYDQLIVECNIIRSK